MPIARLSGSVLGAEDPKRKERADLLYHLFANGWDIYNGNGDQTIHLENIQKKILESDAFVYTPNPSLEDYFNLASIFVGYQTWDDDLNNKTAIVLNSDDSWNSFLELITHLNKLGTVGQPYSKYINIAKTSEDLIDILTKNFKEAGRKESSEPDIIDAGSIYQENENFSKMPPYNVCVFCSASVKKQDYLEEGYNLGKFLAEKGIGCISGAGKTGIMGEVVRGAYENNGWSGGSNVPHIIKMEGLPDGLNEFWPRADIYTRMEVMVDRSDAFVIMPGGMGTIQELLALLILKHQGNDLMRDKKIVVYNKYDDETGLRFWDPVINIIRGQRSIRDDFAVVENFDQILPAIQA